MPRLLHHATWNWGYRAETESTDQDRGSRGADAYSMRTGILIRYEVFGAAQAPAHRGFWEAAPPDGVPSLADGNAPPHRMSRISLECEALSLLESGFPPCPASYWADLLGIAARYNETKQCESSSR